MRRPNSSVLCGFLCCFTMILTGIITNGGIKTIFNFIHIPSMIVTFGGAFFAVLTTTESFSEFLDGLGSIRLAFTKKGVNLDDIANDVYELSVVSRKDGLLALEERSEKLENDFLRKGIRLAVDGTEAELVKDIMETEMLHHGEENRRRVSFWENMGAYAPAWGMVGTLLGLINMMKGMGTDSSQIGAGMSLALLTTLYGSVLANWVCIPVATKIKRSGSVEQLEMELIIEGVLSIQAGDNPMVIKEKIRTFRSEWEEILPSKKDTS